MTERPQVVLGLAACLVECHRVTRSIHAAASAASSLEQVQPQSDQWLASVRLAVPARTLASTWQEWHFVVVAVLLMSITIHTSLADVNRFVRFFPMGVGIREYAARTHDARGTAYAGVSRRACPA